MKITCLGSGVFSLALAKVLAKKKENQIVIWTHDEENAFIASQENKLILDGKKVCKPQNILVTSSLSEALKDTSSIFLLVSSSYVKDLVLKIKKDYKPNIPVFIGSKGLLNEKPYYFTHFIKKALNAKKIAFFAGPNLAKDLFHDAEVFITVATKDRNAFSYFQSIVPRKIHLEQMREEKVLELASVLKNVYAIGAGMAYAKSPFRSTVFSYLTEAYKEYNQILYEIFDYSNETVYAGTLGDFFLTGSSFTSRNFSYGRLLVKTKKEASLFSKCYTVEGKNNLEILPMIIKKMRRFPLLYQIWQENRLIK